METNFMQVGDTIACGHCQPQKYAKAEPCACLCHSKAPENNYPRCTGCDTQIATTGPSVCESCYKQKIPVEAPTDESWTVEFDKEFACPHKGVNCTGRCLFSKSNVKSFIASLIQKERENAYNDQPDATSIYNKGKSEAFSLVKSMLEDYFKNLIHIPEPLATLHSILNKLSTLEGK